MTFEIGTILASTDGIVRRVEYHRFKHPVEYDAIMSEVSEDIGNPITAARESSEVYRFVYSHQDRPAIFSDDHTVYSTRLDTTTGEVTGKAYDLSNPLNKEVDYFVLATGVYLDNSRYTLYHAVDGESLPPETFTKIDVPYIGTTYNADGSIYRTTHYSVQE